MVMGFRSKIKTRQQIKTENKSQKNQQSEVQDKNLLTREEINYVLGIIKDTTFKGSEIERLYNIVYKLQSQYLKQGKDV
jgi:hypothetical protein